MAVIAVAAVLIPFQDWQTLWHMPTPDVWGVVSLIALAVLSEFLSVSATVGKHQAASSILFIPLFACVLLFPAPAALLLMGVTSVFAQVFIHKRPLLRGAFNTAQLFISISVALAVFHSAGGRYSLPLNLHLLSIRDTGSLAALVITFFFVNHMLLSVAIALINGDRVATVFSRAAALSGGNLLYDVLASPVAVVVALLYSSWQTWGIIVGTLPFFVIRQSYQTNAKLHQANKDLLSVLVKTLETRDPYTSGHSIRVSILARAIAEDMDLSVRMVDGIEMAALVHDIGKIDAIYTSIIQKEGKLSETERDIIVTHAAKGAEFLETLSSFRADVIEGVRHHHERYDGTGYPSRLAGEQIPLAGRIIMLCDSIDAMLSDRPYRKALPIEDVRLEILRCAGTQFDPRIVDIILKRNTLERAAALVRPESHKPPHLVAVSA